MGKGERKRSNVNVKAKKKKMEQLVDTQTNIYPGNLVSYSACKFDASVRILSKRVEGKSTNRAFRILDGYDRDEMMREEKRRRVEREE